MFFSTEIYFFNDFCRFLLIFRSFSSILHYSVPKSHFYSFMVYNDKLYVFILYIYAKLMEQIEFLYINRAVAFISLKQLPTRQRYILIFLIIIYIIVLNISSSNLYYFYSMPSFLNHTPSYMWQAPIPLSKFLTHNLKLLAPFLLLLPQNRENKRIQSLYFL